ncbi:MAG: hypothetical protein H6841_09170 [Planctomycetes bacterium]|nr:hypothetical protein [Planctomycetota bacterium]
MKPLPFLMMLLLLAACAGGPSQPEDDGGFVSSDTAADASAGNTAQPRRPDATPLTAEEEKAAALKINQLEEAAADADRNKLIEELVALGPRYLGFFKAIDREVVALDMMYVIRRIEREHKLENTGGMGTGKTEGNGAVEETSLPDFSQEREDFDREQVERFLATRLQQARRMLDGGRYESARRVAEAAITLLPDSRLRAEFDALILQAKGESQSDLLIAGTLSLEPENLQYAGNQKAAAFKAPLQIRCFLKNVSTAAITLRLYEGEGRESVLQLGVTYEQLDFQGNAMSQTGTVRLPIDAGESITLQPNESYEINVPLESLASLDSDAPRKNALGAVQIEAALRVYGALDADGDPLVLRPIKFPTRNVHVFPSGFDLEGATTKPLTALRDALDKGLAQELYMAAHLVGRREKRSAGDLLVGDDFEDCTLAMQRARLLSMNVIFETGKAWDIKRWRQWWDENRLRQ